MRKRDLKWVVMSLIVLGLGLFIYSSVSPAEDVLTSPSDVYIDKSNNTLIVSKPNDSPMPFVIKGVSWSPATKAPSEGPNPLNPNESVQYGFFFDWSGRYPQGNEVLNYWLKNQLSANYLTDIPLMKQMNVNTVRIYHSLGSTVEDYTKVANEIKVVLDEFYRNGIMVIMTAAISKSDLDSQKYLKVVEAYKNHPAILMWSIGNEWNLNKFYDSLTLEETAQAVNQAAQRIRELDTYHPVSSVLGDVFDNSNNSNCPMVWIIGDVLQRCPNIDVWGLNVYRGDSFGNLFEQWKTQWQSLNQLAKPFYISEFGIDSFNTATYSSNGSCPSRADTISGNIDEQKQAEVNAKLWNEIKGHLALYLSGELCQGGLIHEFNDELWKVGSYHVGLGGLIDYNNPPDNHSYDDYNPEGFVLPGGSPDSVLNEEYFGLVTADRTPKLAYERMNKEWVLTPPTTPVVTDSGIWARYTTQLYASWSSSDPESGIAEYQYAIGTSAGVTDVVGWTSAGTNTSVTHTGLSLVHGTTYYFSVKAKNGAGLWSDEGYSNGIKVDNPPLVGTITPSSGSSPVYTPVTFTTTYSDADGWQDIRQAYFRLRGFNSVETYYDQNTNKLYLRDSLLFGWKGGFAPGSANFIVKPYAILDCSKTTVSGSGNTLTINWNIIFKPRFIGKKYMYLYVRDDVGAGSGWKLRGTWTIQ